MEGLSIPFFAPSIQQPEIDEVVATLKSGWLGRGLKTEHFERLFNNFIGGKYVFAVNSCTSALYLSLLVLNLSPGDEVIVPTMTFASTAGAIIQAGGKPVFVDCELDTLNIDIEGVYEKITPKTKAIVPVHFAGRPCEVGALLKIAKDHQLIIIEDCAHGLGASYQGRSVGTFDDFGCFSFYITKNITTGEGGMVVAKNKASINKIKSLACQGLDKIYFERCVGNMQKHYQIIEPGLKCLMTDLNASIGIHQLPKLKKYQKRRKVIWNRYIKALKHLPIITPPPEKIGTEHAYHLFTILLDLDNTNVGRDEFINIIRSNGIGVGMHFMALHLHPYYRKNFGYKKGDFPNSEWISERTVSLPLYPSLTNRDIDSVVRVVKHIVS